MKFIFAALSVCAALLSSVAFAALDDAAQRAVFAAAINAETNATVVACRAVRDDACIAGWYNQAASPQTLAWRESVSRSVLFEATNLTSFDNLTAGKRDAWGLMMANAPINMSRNAMRKAVADIWSAADRDAALTACTEPATRFELVFGGASATTGSVTAIKRNVLGPVSVSDVSASLNP